MMRSTLPARIYSTAQIRQLDRIAIEARGIPGLTLMRRAAAACVDTIFKKWPSATTVLVYCGSGNNAGDGYIVAGMLAEKNVDVTVIVVGDIEKLKSDAASAYEYCQTTDASLVSYDEAEEVPEGIDVVVDALLGTGMRGQVKAAYRLAVETINAGAAPVLSVDIPSGLDADTGSVLGVAVQANVTVTFIGLKQGLMTNDGPGRAGELVFSDLAVPADIFDEVGPTIQRLVYQELIDDLPKRRANVHKNRFGHVLVVGGDEGMGGAVLMAAEAALRSGAGLVTVATHKSHAGSIINRRPELMVRSLDHSGGLDELLKRATVIALGPGLGRSKWSEEVFNRVMQADLPSVVDADGLNFLAQHPSKRDNWILTPHPGEATNLLGQSLSGSRSVQSDRYAAIRQIQDQYGGVVLLKGLGSIIHSESGTSLSQYGNPGMSTAGMGDVLTGVIAGLLAQDCDPYFAARLGAVVHSLAADQNTQINGERGLMATDLMAGIRRLVNDI